MWANSIYVSVCSELALVRSIARQLETDVRKRRNILCFRIFAHVFYLRHSSPIFGGSGVSDLCLVWAVAMPGDGANKPPLKPKPKPDVGATSTPKPAAGTEGGAAGGTPTEDKPTVTDYNRLSEVARRLRVENEDALAEIDRLVAEVRDLREEKLDNEERELDLFVLEMGDSKNLSLIHI